MAATLGLSLMPLHDISSGKDKASLITVQALPN